MTVQRNPFATVVELQPKPSDRYESYPPARAV